MKLYHASTAVIDCPDVHHSWEHLDFGKGFYLTVLPEQARKYALRFLLRGQAAYLNAYELDDELPGYEVKRFARYDEEWLDYVSECRKGTSRRRYDVVEGGIANDRVFNTIDLYFAGLLNKDDALGRLKFEHPNHQLCILNQAVIDRHLRFVGAEEIKTEGGPHASR